MNNTEFGWDKNTLSKAYLASGLPCLIHIGMVGQSMSYMKNGKPAGPSGLLSGMVKSESEEGIYITEEINQI